MKNICNLNNKAIDVCFCLCSSCQSSGHLGEVGQEERGVGQEVEDPGAIQDAKELENEASNFAAPADVVHLILGRFFHVCEGMHVSVGLPVALVDFDHERFGGLFDLVAVSWESAGIDVIDLSDRSKSDELDNDIDGLVD